MPGNWGMIALAGSGEPNELNQTMQNGHFVRDRDDRAGSHAERDFDAGW
jgi:hypothetical protein